MNSDFWGGIFVGGICAMLLETFLMQFDLVGLTPMIFIIIFDIILFFGLEFEKIGKRRKKK